MLEQISTSGIKKFILKLGNQSFTAKGSNFPHIQLKDEGLRTIIRIDHTFCEGAVDDNGEAIAVFGKWLKQGYRITIRTEVKIHLKKIGKSVNPDIRIKTPDLFSVHDSEGNEIVSPDIIDLIRCELETGQSMTIEFSDEFRRQTGRTSRFIETLKPGDVVIANSLTHATQLCSLISDIVGDMKIGISVMGFDEVKKNIKEGKGGNYRFPHEFFEYHKINVDNIYNLI